MTSLTPIQARDEFPILRNRNYLNSCSLGALSHRAEAYLDDFRDRWHTMGASAWYEHWLGRTALLRSRIEAFAGGEEGSIALLPSTSSALSAVAESLHRAVGGGAESGHLL